jgi:hypothetical protein
MILLDSAYLKSAMLNCRSIWLSSFVQIFIKKMSVNFRYEIEFEIPFRIRRIKCRNIGFKELNSTPIKQANNNDGSAIQREILYKCILVLFSSTCIFLYIYTSIYPGFQDATIFGLCLVMFCFIFLKLFACNIRFYLLIIRNDVMASTIKDLTVRLIGRPLTTHT